MKTLCPLKTDVSSEIFIKLFLIKFLYNQYINRILFVHLHKIEIFAECVPAI